MASPAISMGRVVRLGSNAIFTFQLPQTGLNPADISYQAYHLDSASTQPLVNSAVVETSIPGTYMLTVQAGDMTAGGVYYAAVGYDTVAFRIPAWSYAPANEFDQVLADLADIDANIEAAVATLEGDLNAQTATLQGNISSAVTTLQGNLSTTQTSLHNDILAGVSTLQTDVANAKTVIQGDISSAKSAIQGDIAAAVTTIDNHTDSAVNAARDVVTGAISTAQTSLHNDILSGVSTLQGDISNAKTDLHNDINAAKVAIQSDISMAKTDVIAEINANEAKIDTLTTNLSNLSTLVTNETNQIDSAIAAVDSKAQDAKVASESLVADFADATLSSSAGRLKSLLDSIATDATASKMAAEAVRDEVGMFSGPNFGTLADMLGSAGFESSNKSLYARLGDLDSAVAALETEADADSRQSAVLGRFDSVDGQLAEKYTLAQGVTDQIALLSRFSAVDSAVSAVKAVLDSSLLENAKLIPNVPTSILSPMAEQVIRFSCNVTGPSGTSLAGALEDPDDQEVGVRLFMSDGSTGAMTEVSGSNLFEDSGKNASLPACAGSLNGVPSTFKKMKRSGVGQYYAFMKLEAYKHGNLQFEFQIVDSDPSSTPQIYQAVRYTEVRRLVSFTSFGAF